ncbi:MAG: hypothetical protein NC485_10105 [Ruminococcus flavefaciens]|nr:hypothetical protein [Ruminococcus flavefaciens]MCM1059249.1 hypothetical protein [Eubacterium sp.]
MIKAKAGAGTGLIAPVDKSLSLEARGVLAVMLNDPCCDYQPIENLYNMFCNDSRSAIKNALSELRENGYVIELPSNVFAVNKTKIHDMLIIGR